MRITFTEMDHYYSFDAATHLELQAFNYGRLRWLDHLHGPSGVIGAKFQLRAMTPAAGQNKESTPPQMRQFRRNFRLRPEINPIGHNDIPSGLGCQQIRRGEQRPCRQRTQRAELIRGDTEPE